MEECWLNKPSDLPGSLKDSNTMKTQSRTPTLANVVTKHSISSELAQKMVDEAVAKARELGVTENVAILDDLDLPSGPSSVYFIRKGPETSDH